MAALKDQAICIRTQNYSESSQIVTLFGREAGKIRAIAKGSRRPRSNFSGGIELLAAAHIIFVPAHGEASLATLCEFQVHQSFTALRQNLLGLNCAQYAAWLIAEFTEDFDPHETLYLAFEAALHDFQHTDRPETTLLSLERILLREVGLAPDWKTCAACRKPLPARRRLYFSARSGGMLCRDCESAVPEKRFIDPQALAVLQNPHTVENAPRRDVLEAHELLCYYQREVLAKAPPIMGFLQQLLRQKIKRNQP